MPYRFSRTWLKVLAAILAALCLCGAFFYGVIWLIGINMGFLEGQPIYQTTIQCAQVVRSCGSSIIEQYQHNPSFQYWDRLLQKSNLRFIILDEKTGDVKASYLEGLGFEAPANLKDNIYLSRYDYTMSRGEYGTVLEDIYVCDFYFGSNAQGVFWSSDSSNWEDYSEWEVTVSELPAALDETEGEDSAKTSYQILYLLGDRIELSFDDEIANGYQVFLYYWQQYSSAAAGFAVLAALTLAFALYLLATAGRRAGQEALHCGWLEKLPTDLMLVVGFFAGLGFCACAVALCETTHNGYLTLEELALIQWLTTLGGGACGMVLLAILVSFSVRIKGHFFWRSALLFRMASWCWSTLRRGGLWAAEQVRLGLRSLGMVPRAAAVTLAVMLVEFLLFALACDSSFFLLVLLSFNVLLFFAILWVFTQLRLLQNAARDLAEGNLEHHLDTDRMYWDFKRHGESLNAISDGMNKAVEQRMKSERLKTELITNVSHDIKTPLTSIVNYVDLLQKPHSQQENAQYLEVLDRQAKRLKKLTENLVEASKASTGNLPVELRPTSVLELLNQAVEEYRDRLEAGKLEIVMDLRGDLSILADGKHMWRILDNLLNNVIKYALPGTRVYVTAQKREDRVVIAVKNISRDPLNVSADELMERFVRGDSSRSTEGSGLGLNIARSLTALQNGQFSLTVDGDLFKAEVSMPCVAASKTEE